MGFSRTYVHLSSSGASRGAHFVYARGSTLGSASDCALASDASDAKTTSAHNAPALSECMSYAASVRRCDVVSRLRQLARINRAQKFFLIFEIFDV